MLSKVGDFNLRHNIKLRLHHLSKVGEFNRRPNIKLRLDHAK